MRSFLRGTLLRVLVGFSLMSPGLVHATPFEELSKGRRAFHTAQAVAANTVPGVASLYEPKCLPGYIFCKAAFAIFSVAAAAESLVMSGGQDMEQPRAVLYRGFGGDWFLTPRDMAGDTKPQLLPEPPPAAEPTEPGSDFTPPPL